MRGCEEGTGGKRQRCLCSTAGCAYVVIAFIATGGTFSPVQESCSYLYCFFPVLFNNTAHSSKMFLTCSCIVRDIDIAGNSGACPSQMGDFLLCHGEAF